MSTYTAIPSDAKGPNQAQPVLVPYPGYNAVYTPVDVPAPPKSSRTRFIRLCHFLSLTILAGILLSTFAGHLRPFRSLYGDDIISDHGRMEPHEPCFQQASWSRTDPDGHNRVFAASTSFDLPLSSDELYLIASGSLSAGSVYIDHHPSETTGWEDQVRVEIEARTHREDTLDLAEVCLLHPASGKYGVGIFTPKYQHPHHTHDHIVFQVTVHLPRPVDDEPTYVKAFRANVPLFSISSADLSASALFSFLSLRTANSAAHLDGITAETAEVKTSNAPIEGTFNTTTTLDLSTSNAPIYVTANLFNGETDGERTRASLRTSNGVIRSTLNLISTADSGLGGAFLVSAETSNSPLALSVPEIAPDAALQLAARTSNSPAHLAVHEAYEGTFEVRTSRWFKAAVLVPEQDSDGRGRRTDPKGEGRTRAALVMEQKNGEARGWTAWLKEGERGPTGKGELRLSTSNSPAELII